MKAVQYDGTAPRVVEVADPAAGPGQVVLKVTGAGLCHSDLAVMARDPEDLGFDLPITLGHEAAGVVVEVGTGVRGTRVGDEVAVYGPRGCGTCRSCLLGAENHCPRARAAGILPPGLGAPGALAEYLLVDDPRHLVRLDGLDHVRAAPLTDAGLTSYHAVRTALPALPPGGTAVVVGVGGLGHVAVQILRVLSGARIVALDIVPEKLELAARAGADETLLFDDCAAEAVRGLTAGAGADVVLDFVAAGPTLRLAAEVTRPGGEISVVGVGTGQLPVAVGKVPLGVTVRTPYWGTRSDLSDVLELARSGRITVEVEQYLLEEAPAAYRRLARGRVQGRAVVVPERAAPVTG